MKHIKLFKESTNNVMTIIDLSKTIAKIGVDSDSILLILQDKYQKYGDEGVVNAVKEMTGIKIKALKQGAYIFDEK